MPKNGDTTRTHGWRQALHRLLRWFRASGLRPSRQLRLCETLALGEKRFLAVIEFEEQKLLIGGTGSSLAMLTTLPCQKSAKVNTEGEREIQSSWEA